MKQRIYIDVNTYIGRTNFKAERIPYTAQALLEDMHYYRVHSALAVSGVSRDYSFVRGNDEILAIADKEDRIHGIATVVPHVKYEIDGGERYYEKLIKSGAKGFKLYPASFSHSFSPFFLEDIAGFMIARDLPMIIDIGETDWDKIAMVLQTFPELKLLVCNSHWKMTRSLFPLMEKFSNLYFEINASQSNDIIEICKYHFGTDRILFGSHYPDKVMGGLKALVEYADISEEEKNQIAFENAAKLFKLNPEDIKLYDDECQLDEIARVIDSGEKLEKELVIDAHAHLVDKRDLTVSYMAMVGGDEDRLIQKMDRLGIDKFMILIFLKKYH